MKKKVASLELCNPVKSLTHCTGKCKLVCDGMRSFQSLLQREGLGSILLVFYFRVHTEAKLLGRIRKVS